MQIVNFIVMGEPVGKGRPRVVHNGNKTHAYTPKKTVDYENLIKAEYVKQTGGEHFGEKPLSIIVAAFFAIPKATTKARRELMLRGGILPSKVPDSDNILKAVSDALNGVAYGDDKQIVFAKISKRYAITPRLEITISEVETVGENQTD